MLVAPFSSSLVWRCGGPCHSARASYSTSSALPWPRPSPHSQKEEMPSVEVAQLMLALPRRCPQLTVEALDAEQFFGVTLRDLDTMP